MKKVGYLLFLWVLLGTASNSFSNTNDYSEKSKKIKLTKFEKLSGRVADGSGKAIPNVTIQIYGEPSFGSRTDSDGRFLFDVPKDQEFGLCFDHICYCGKNMLFKPKQIKSELNVVLAERVPQFDLKNEKVNLNDCEKRLKMPVPKLNLAEEGEVLITMEYPEFRGGTKNLFEIFKQEKQTVLAQLRASGQDLKGTFHGTFVVDNIGNISTVKLDERISRIELESIEEIFRRMGKWKPGIQLGIPVDVKFSFIVEF